MSSLGPKTVRSKMILFKLSSINFPLQWKQAVIPQPQQKNLRSRGEPGQDFQVQSMIFFTEVKVYTYKQKEYCTFTSLSFISGLQSPLCRQSFVDNCASREPQDLFAHLIPYSTPFFAATLPRSPSCHQCQGRKPAGSEASKQPEHPCYAPFCLKVPRLYCAWSRRA